MYISEGPLLAIILTSPFVSMAWSLLFITFVLLEAFLVYLWFWNIHSVSFFYSMVSDMWLSVELWFSSPPLTCGIEITAFLALCIVEE